jgi:Flp pilus assembly protein TadG
VTRAVRRTWRMLARRVRARQLEDDRGSILIWFVITAPVIILLAVLIVDGGAKEKAGEQASAYSAEAARAATLAVGPDGGSGQTQSAVAAADKYLASAGVDGTTTITGPATVQVRVTVSVDGPISGHTWTVTRTATARLLVGVENGQAP